MLISVDEMYDGLFPMCQKFHLEEEYLLYNKINMYVYVALKLLKCKEYTQDTKDKIRCFLENKKVNLFKYRNYNIKKYVTYKILKSIKIL